MKHANRALIGLATVGLLGGTIIATTGTTTATNGGNAPAVSDPFDTSTSDAPVITDPPGSSTTTDPGTSTTTDPGTSTTTDPGTSTTTDPGTSTTTDPGTSTTTDPGTSTTTDPGTSTTTDPGTSTTTDPGTSTTTDPGTSTTTDPGTSTTTDPGTSTTTDPGTSTTTDPGTSTTTDPGTSTTTDPGTSTTTDPGTSTTTDPGTSTTTDPGTTTTTVAGALLCVGDRVWLDGNGNGVQDAGEVGLNGVAIQVTYLGADQVLGGVDDQVFNTVTGGDGTWQVCQLPAGKYIISVTSGLPAGVVPSFDPDSGTTGPDGTTMLMLTTDNSDQDFGYRYTSSIGDTVFRDENGNGVQDAGDVGIVGAKVTLTGPGPDGLPGTGDDTTSVDTTDGSGKYLFPFLPAGDYRVDVDTSTVPAGLVNSFDEDGNKDSSTPVALGVSDDHLTADFGYTVTPSTNDASIGDTIYRDLNGNGTQDPGEPGVSGQQVKLTSPGPDGVLDTADDVNTTTTTDGSGKYIFTGLAGGPYRVMVVGGITVDWTNSGDPDGGTPNVSDLTITGGVDNLAQDFGYAGNNTIGDTVWIDLNSNGVDDAGEPRLPGVDVAVVWLGPDRERGGGDDVSMGVFTTNSNGFYLATNLPDGRFSVDVTGGVPLGYTITFDPQGPVSPDGLSTVTVSGGGANYDQDFGYVGPFNPNEPLGSIGDRVFFDTNGDMAQGDPADEPGIVGVIVTLRSAGPDGTFGTADDIVATDTTDSNGNYLFARLPGGEYRVDVDQSALPADFVNTFDEDGNKNSSTTVSLGQGEHHLTADFGYDAAPVVLGSIGDRVFLDTNGDGVQGDPSSEPGIGGVTVSLTAAGPDGLFGTADDVTSTTTTAADGTYLFTDLTPGKYKVTVTGGLPGSVINTSDPDGGNDSTSEVTLAPGESNVDQDFGYDTASLLGDRVWLDLNRDGIQDPAEPGINGVTVTVTYFGRDNVEGTADDITFVAVTSGDGDYLISGIPDGLYRVEITGGVPASYVPTYDDDSGLNLPDQMSLVSLVTSDLDQDFGYALSFVLPTAPTGTVTGRVWNDVDKDGVQDPTEPGLSGVRVTLLSAGGTVVDSIVTGTGGNYTFDKVTPGDYRTVIDPATVPSRFVQSFESDGSRDQTVSFAVVADTTVSGGIYGFCARPAILPSTGFDPLAFMLSAAALIFAGLVLLLRGPRRRSPV